MALVIPIKQVFHGGIASRTALARVDVERLATHGAVMTNWLGKPIGAMQARPGFERMGSGDANAWMMAYAFDGDATAVLEFRDQEMLAWSGGARLSRAAATMSITNADWASLTGWTATTPGTTSATVASNELTMIARDDDTPTVEQEITVAAGTHAISFSVVRGPIRFRVGSTQGAEDIFGSTFLDTGDHEIQWVSTGSSFWIQFASEQADIQRIVGAISLATAGDLSLSTGWTQAALQSLRIDQIADRLFSAEGATKQKVIERRANDSWSIVDYDFRDGPFLSVFEHRETITPSAVRGNVTLTASAPVFESSHVGALFQLTHNTQTATQSVSALEAVTDALEITGGSDDDRTIDVTIDKTTGAFNGTIVIERAFGDPVNFNTWETYTGTTDVSTTLDENNDDRIVFVRARVTAYTSGSADITLFVPQGETLGVARITAVASSTSASAEALTEFGDTTAVTKWREGEWSDKRGWPAVPLEHDGRLWWFSGTRIWGSVSDDFYSFDENIEGDSAPIDKAIGGRAAEVRGAASLGSSIAILTSLGERTIQANDFGDIITRESANLRNASGHGANAAAPALVDDRVFFVDRGERRPFVFGDPDNSQRFQSVRLDFFTEQLFGSAVKQMAVQRKPHTRIWYLLENGDLYAFLYEPSEESQGFCKIESDGFTFKTIAIEPSTEDEDRIWTTVVDGEGAASVWRMFKESEAVGGTLNKMLDDAVFYEGAATSTITGLGHLNGVIPGVWADGAQVDVSAPVASASLTLPADASAAVVGRPYVSDWKGAKVAYGAQGGTALTKPKRLQELALVCVDTCLDGLRLGVSEEAEYVHDAPRVIHSEQIAPGRVFSEIDIPLEPIGGGNYPDPRPIIRNIAPNPATVTALVYKVEVLDG